MVFARSREEFCRCAVFMCRMPWRKRCAKRFSKFASTPRFAEVMQAARSGPIPGSIARLSKAMAFARARSRAFGRSMARRQTRRRTLWRLVRRRVFWRIDVSSSDRRLEGGALRFGRALAREEIRSCSIRNGSRRICCNSAGSKSREINTCIYSVVRCNCRAASCSRSLCERELAQAGAEMSRLARLQSETSTAPSAFGHVER